MASVFEQLQEKYRGFSIDHSTDEKKTTITYQGTKELCLEATTTLFKIGSSNKDYGTIENVRLTNQGNRAYL